ncbi:MAG: NAD-dependent protein deacylase [Deltaproteobacteria bacterium]|nr:NAD-dependent protein deacylase [Deltaproteobacteria bacterium]
MGKWNREIEKAASILAESKYATATCGAGVSAESSIPTFRDPGGIWDRLDPSEVGTVSGLINTLERKSDLLLPFFFDFLDTFERAEPNPGHYAIASLEKKGVLKSVITQNVDNLHQEAGTKNLIEVHGNFFRMACLSCNHKNTVDRKLFIKKIRNKLKSLTTFDLGSFISFAVNCEQCNKIMRPDVVMFGEAVQELPAAFNVSEKSDVMLVLGTSGVVYPAAYFPIKAKEAGAKIIIINPNENPFPGHTDVYIPLKTGEAMPAILKLIS